MIMAFPNDNNRNVYNNIQALGLESDRIQIAHTVCDAMIMKHI